MLDDHNTYYVFICINLRKELYVMCNIMFHVLTLMNKRNITIKPTELQHIVINAKGPTQIVTSFAYLNKCITLGLFKTFELDYFYVRQSLWHLLE